MSILSKPGNIPCFVTQCGDISFMSSGKMAKMCKIEKQKNILIFQKCHKNK